LAEKNKIDGNRSYGISVGHCDTDNVMRDNDITNSGLVGVLFRDENRGRDFWANRNVLENNRIHDSGGESGVAIDIQGQTKDLKIVRNELRETRGPMQRVGIRIAAGFNRDVEIEGTHPRPLQTSGDPQAVAETAHRFQQQPRRPR